MSNVAMPDLFFGNEWEGWGDFLGSMFPYDWEVIEILKFNYNGQGDAIANCDGETKYVHLADLNTILFGDQYGIKHYDVYVVTSGSFILKKIHYKTESVSKKGKNKIVQKKRKQKL